MLNRLNPFYLFVIVNFFCLQIDSFITEFTIRFVKRR